MAIPPSFAVHGRPRIDQANAQACSDFLRRLVQTPSLSGQEASVARMVASEMRTNGFPSVHADRIGNVIGRYGRPGGPTLLLNAHMDTVDIGDPDAWIQDPFSGEVSDKGRLYGRGSVDMKGALAAMIYGVGMLAQHGVDLPGEVVVAAVVQQEPTEGRRCLSGPVFSHLQSCSAVHCLTLQEDCEYLYE